MKKYILSISLILLHFFANTQVRFQIASANANKNDTVSLQVTTTGFTNVVSTQYSINYDSAVLSIVDVVKTASYDVDHATHMGSATVKNGQLTFVWSSSTGTGVNLNNGTLLFTLRFKLIGKECDSSFVRLSSKPTVIEVLDGNFNTLTLTATDAKVKINGTGCVNEPPPNNEFQIWASTETTPQGVTKCIKVSTRNFKNIQSGQFTMRWDKTVAKFDNIISRAMTLVFGQNFAALPDSSGVGITWDAGRDPLFLADSTVLFELCLKPVGASGAMTAINFDGSQAAIEFTDGNDNIVPVKFTSGKLTITGIAINLHTRDTMVEEGSTFCIPIRVDNFKCVESFQFSVQFDTAKLKFSNFLYHMATFGSTNVNLVKDSVRVLWDATAGPQDLPNGGPIFSICFESKLSAPNCPFTTKFKFTDLHSGPIEFFNCNGNEFAVAKTEPEFTVKCRSAITPVTLIKGTRTAVKCKDDCNGSVTQTPPSGGKGPFQYSWRLQPNNVEVSTALSPTDLCPGVYRLCVIDLGNANKETCFDTLEITNQTAISCTAVVTHATPTNPNGSIILTPTGGVLPYTFRWIRLSSGTQVGTSKDLINVPNNRYKVTVTDANNCMKMDTFIINPPPLNFVNFFVVDSNRCFGDCRASVQVGVAGGCLPYTYKWSDPLMQTRNQADGLCKGTYTVTVTDNCGTSLTATYVVTEPDIIEIALDSIVKSSGSNGGVFITIKGGKSPYKTFHWTNANNQTVGSEEDLRNVASGTYTFVVTDNNGCTRSATYTVESSSTNPPVLTINLAIDPKLGGNHVTCRGRCDGKIVATVTSTNPRMPYNYKWSHNASINSNIVTDLCPGQYTLTVTDAIGTSKTASITVLDATPITLSSKRLSCATSSNDFDGRYEAIVTGAVAPVSYQWCSGATTKIASDLPGGSCRLQVTDANGCTAAENFTVCIGNSGIECYTGRLAISPNGDGYNDVLEIACATDLENSLTVFDRWGNSVFAAVNYTNDWGGTDQSGAELTEGTYMWILKVKETGKADVYYKGTVTIVR